MTIDDPRWRRADGGWWHWPEGSTGWQWIPDPPPTPPPAVAATAPVVPAAAARPLVRFILEGIALVLVGLWMYHVCNPKVQAADNDPTRDPSWAALLGALGGWLAVAIGVIWIARGAWLLTKAGERR